MAELGPITVTVSVSLGTTKLPVQPIAFEVPLRTTELTPGGDGHAVTTIDLDRTGLREHLTKSVRTLADQIEGAFLAPGAVLLECDQCEAQIVSEVLATLRHEADGAHSIGQGGRITTSSNVEVEVAEAYIPLAGNSRSGQILVDAAAKPPTSGPAGGAGDSGALEE
jgi:hypothetical protein